MGNARVQQLQGGTIPLMDEAMMPRAKWEARGIVPLRLGHGLAGQPYALPGEIRSVVE